MVEALNQDLPYDRFVVEQLAGDLFPDGSQEQVVATGFLRNSMINEEGGTDPEQFRMEAMFDRLDAIGKSVLGLTIQCAQCHDHKYDPMTQKEYYQLFSFLNNSHEANVPTYTPAEQMKRADLLVEIGQIEARLQHHRADRQRSAQPASGGGPVSILLPRPFFSSLLSATGPRRGTNRKGKPLPAGPLYLPLSIRTLSRFANFRCSQG